MTKREVQVVLIVAGLVLVVSAVLADDMPPAPTPGTLPEGVVTADPLEPITGPGSANPGTLPGRTIDAADVQLCRCAPLNSFAPICEGVTWGNLPFFGRIDFRNQLPPDCR